ncbi:hypothetical protein BCR33DRAFT_829041 [Rhizoclosmatium globosum]|uniref:Uncharacterized protein n=1 Tax=Rhizoclosmatium globosum TaxID=329046 RepID=A0A1Y2C0V8_9FUNG|nr:hypothetical protein BCR33DRAFT_829041 [Rhizoclosmatium globosum]|eukprot:ORY39945.1 hypothetical protein BCR33DRAFT_829041 [Rhizoclosmatium globosum]
MTEGTHTALAKTLKIIFGMLLHSANESEVMTMLTSLKWNGWTVADTLYILAHTILNDRLCDYTRSIFWLLLSLGFHLSGNETLLLSAYCIYIRGTKPSLNPRVFFDNVTEKTTILRSLQESTNPAIDVLQQRNDIFYASKILKLMTSRSQTVTKHPLYHTIIRSLYEFVLELKVRALKITKASQSLVQFEFNSEDKTLLASVDTLLSSQFVCDGLDFIIQTVEKSTKVLQENRTNRSSLELARIFCEVSFSIRILEQSRMLNTCLVYETKERDNENQSTACIKSLASFMSSESVNASCPYSTPLLDQSSHYLENIMGDPRYWKLIPFCMKLLDKRDVAILIPMDSSVDLMESITTPQSRMLRTLISIMHHTTEVLNMFLNDYKDRNRYQRARSAVPLKLNAPASGDTERASWSAQSSDLYLQNEMNNLNRVSIEHFIGNGLHHTLFDLC